MSAIFISHSSKDNAIADEVRAWLEAQGHRSVFLDFDPAEGIPAGRDWEQELYRNIRACRGVIVLCSHHSMASRWCFMEITHARALGKHLFPIKIDDCDVDGVLTDRQVIDFSGNREQALQRLWHGMLAAGIDPKDAFDWDGRRPPYPGLMAFQEEDAAIFFGRDEEIGEGLDVLNKVRTLGQTCLVMVLGASGSGKSSLARAGLLPRLRRDVERWFVVDPFRPREDPARELAAVLSRAFDRLGRTVPRDVIGERLREAMADARRDAVGAPAVAGQDLEKPDQAAFLLKVGELEAMLPEGARSPAARYLRLLRSVAFPKETTIQGDGRTGADDQLAMRNVLAELAADLRLTSGRDDVKVLLVIDQFEELLGHSDDHPNTAFLRLLRASLDRPDRPLLALGTMRSDFLGQFQKSPALLDARYEDVSLGPMSTEDVAQVIEKPAQLAAIELEPGLVPALVADAGTEDTLPLLAFTLRELHERRDDDGLLRLRDYRDRLGGLQGAVAKAAEDLLAAERLNLEQEEMLRVGFLSLVRVTDDGTYARRTAQWDELPAKVHPVLEKFVQGRLLVAGGDGEKRTLEVAHEALFRSWGRLVRWLEQSAEALRLRNEVRNASHSWDQGGRADEDLWRGGRLARARELIEGGDLTLEELDRMFVDAASRAERAQGEAEEAARRRELHRAHVVAAVVGVACLIAVVFGVFALIQRGRAQRQTVEAERLMLVSLAPALAAQASQTVGREKQDERRALLARQGFLFDERGRGKAANLVDDALRTVLGVPNFSLILPRYPDRVWAVSYSSDGRWLASGCLDGSVRIWDLRRADSEPLQLTGFTLGVLSVVFSQTKLKLAAAGEDGTIRLWDLERPEVPPTVLGGRQGRIWALAFKPDDRALASGGDEPGIRIWDLSRPDRPPEVVRASSSASSTSLAFSPDGTKLAAGAVDGRLRLWDLSRPDAPPAVLADRHGRIWSLAFGLNGRMLAAGSDLSLSLWPLTESGAGPESVVLGDGQTVFRSVLFSPDHRFLASGSDDGTIRLWDGRAPKEAQVLVGHEDRVWSLAFSPDGQTLASSGDDRTVRLWDLRVPSIGPRVLPTHQKAILSMAFSPNGRLLASGGEDGARVRDLDRPAVAPVAPDGHDGSVTSVAFSSDGEILATSEYNQTVRVSSPLRTSDPVRKPNGLRGNFLAFSPDGRWLATGSGREVHLHEIARLDDSPRTLRGHESWVQSLAFSPDSLTIVSGSQDNTLRLWDLRALDRPPQVLHGHQDHITAVAVRPDGNQLASASKDGTVRLWDPHHPGAASVVLRGHEGPVTSLVYRPQGSTLASGSEDGTIRLWDSQRPDKDPIMLRAQGEAVYALAYSPDGERLASGDAKGNELFWLPDTAALAQRVCSGVRRNLSLEEWTRFVGAAIPYEATCPNLPKAPTLEIATSVPSLELNAPIPLFPSEGTIFYQHQRMTTLRWSKVPAATSYTLEVLWGDNNIWAFVPELKATSYTFTFVGDQSGRWRVRAVDSNGRESPASPWRNFSFQRE